MHEAGDFIRHAWSEGSQAETVVDCVGEGAPGLDAEEVGIRLFRPCGDAWPVGRAGVRVGKGDAAARWSMLEEDGFEDGLVMEAVDPSGVGESGAAARGGLEGKRATGKILPCPAGAREVELPVGALGGWDMEVVVVPG